MKVPLLDLKPQYRALKGEIDAAIERICDSQHFILGPAIKELEAGIAAYCQPENKVSLGFVEGLNNKIRVIQRRAYGLRDEDYLRLKILTCMLPPL